MSLNNERYSEIKNLLKDEFREREMVRQKGCQYSVGWPVFDEKEIYAALDALLELRLSQGASVREFETTYADYLGLPAGSFAVAVNSGSSANLIAFASLIEQGMLMKGDEVAVPASTFATVSTILYQLGLKPLYVDSELQTLNMCPGALERSITKDTKAVMVVHNLGFPANIDELMRISREHNLLFLEDCCEAHGALYKGKQIGSFGDLSTLSFFVAHNITTGEGGMVFAKNPALENTIRSMREFGRVVNAVDRFKQFDSLGEYDTRYVFEHIGFNVRMTDIAAAIGLVQLNKLDQINEIRRANAALLSGILSKYEGSISSLKPAVNSVPAYYGFPILVAPDSRVSRNEICRVLESSGIETRPNMGGCLPDQPAFRGLDHRLGDDLPNSRYIRDHVFFIGVHSALADKHFSLLEECLDNIFQGI